MEDFLNVDKYINIIKEAAENENKYTIIRVTSEKEKQKLILWANSRFQYLVYEKCIICLFMAFDFSYVALVNEIYQNIAKIITESNKKVLQERDLKKDIIADTRYLMNGNILIYKTYIEYLDLKLVMRNLPHIKYTLEKDHLKIHRPVNGFIKDFIEEFVKAAEETLKLNPSQLYEYITNDKITLSEGKPEKVEEKEELTMKYMYRKLSKLFHPDRENGSTEKMQELNILYQDCQFKEILNLYQNWIKNKK